MSRCIHETRIRHGYDAETTSIRVDTREYSVSISNYPKIDIKLPPGPVLGHCEMGRKTATAAAAAMISATSVGSGSVAAVAVPVRN